MLGKSLSKVSKVVGFWAQYQSMLFKAVVVCEYDFLPIPKSNLFWECKIFYDFFTNPIIKFILGM